MRSAIYKNKACNSIPIGIAKMAHQTFAFWYFSTTSITIPISVHWFRSLSSAFSRWCTPQQAPWSKSQVSCSWSGSLPTACQCRSIRYHPLLGGTSRMSLSALIHKACRSAESSIPKRLSCTLRATSQDKWSLRELQSVKYRCSIARWLCSYHSLTVFKWPVNSQSKARSLSPDFNWSLQSICLSLQSSSTNSLRVDDPNPIRWNLCSPNFTSLRDVM